MRTCAELDLTVAPPISIKKEYGCHTCDVAYTSQGSLDQHTRSVVHIMKENSRVVVSNGSLLIFIIFYLLTMFILLLYLIILYTLILTLFLIIIPSLSLLLYLLLLSLILVFTSYSSSPISS